MKKMQKAFSSAYVRRIFSMGAGVSIGQLINIIAIPFLARLYSPENFGIFSLYTNLVLFFGGICSLRFELAIGVCRSKLMAYNVFWLSLMTNFIFTLILAIVCYVFNNSISQLLNTHEISFWLYILPVSVLITGISNSVYYYLIRLSRFRSIALLPTIRNGISNGGAILSGFYQSTAGGLIVSRLLGLAASVSYIVRDLYLAKARYKWFFSWIIKLFFKYKNFSLYLLPARALQYFAILMPFALFTMLFSAKIAGFYALSQKLLRLPTTLISSTTADVFRQEAAFRIQKGGDCSRLFTQTYSKLTLIAIIPTLVLFVFAPFLFSKVFGSNWLEAGEYARLMAIMVFGEFVVYPVSQILVVLNKQYIDFLLQLGATILAIGGFYLGKYYFENAYITVFIFSMVYFCKYVLEFFICKKLVV